MTTAFEELTGMGNKNNEKTNLKSIQETSRRSPVYFIIIIACSILAFYLNFSKNSRCFSSDQMNVFEKIFRAFFAGLGNIVYLIYHFVFVRPYGLRGSCMDGGYPKIP